MRKSIFSLVLFLLAQNAIQAQKPELKPTIGELGCADGQLRKINNFQMGFRDTAFEQGRIYEMCFHLPPADMKSDKARKPLVEIQTVNKANFQCSDFEMAVVVPHRENVVGQTLSGENRVLRSGGSQPGTGYYYTPGKWRIYLRLNSGCNRYDLNVRWSMSPKITAAH